jgi:CHAD domain-containing protein
MPAHLNKAAPTDRVLRRVCREQLGEALVRLRQSRPPAAVHGVRKEIKKLRAIFRLVREEIGRAAYRKARKSMRRAAGQLASARDARVMFQAFEQLAGEGAARRFPILHRTLKKHCRRATHRFNDADAGAAAGRALRKTGRHIDRLKFTASGWAALAPGLRQSYQRGRQAGEQARRQPSPEHLHAWRKEVTTFWYQLRLLRPDWPGTTRTLTQKLNRLGELLGDHHDLVLLKQFVTEQTQNEEATALNPLIEARQIKLSVAALKLGAQVYKRSPAKIGQQMGEDWSRWHGHK